MPIKRCELNGEPGFKWGDMGKCYTYDPDSLSEKQQARKKALKQGIAIGDFKVTGNRISFDYDGTITIKKYQDMAVDFLKSGDEVFIVTARNKIFEKPVFDMADKLGIKKSNVIFTNGKNKLDFLKRLNIDIHYDNNPDQVKNIKNNSDIKAILV